MKITKLLLPIITIACFFSCKFSIEKKETVKLLPKGYFEGEIKLSESRGLYGSLFKVHTTYVISENSLKREQKLGGVNNVFNNKAGIIIDLEKDSVVLYFTDLNTKKKHSLTVKAFKKYLTDRRPSSGVPSPVDHTYRFFDKYKVDKTVKDSMMIDGFMTDYNRYTESFMQQEVFDSKTIKIKRELLEMVFLSLPDETNFPLKSEIRTIVSNISNDTLINNDGVKLLDKLAKDVAHNIDSTTDTKPADLEKLSKNKWLNLGLKAFKKGVDLQIHISNEVSDISLRSVALPEFSLPSGSFDEIDDIDDFFDAMPTAGSGDFDD